MSRLTRDGTAEPVSRDHILRHARGQGNINFPCSADHEQDWQPYPVDPYSAICDDHTYIHTIAKLLLKYFQRLELPPSIGAYVRHRFHTSYTDSELAGPRNILHCFKIFEKSLIEKNKK